MFLILTYFWNLILLLPRLLGAFLSDTSTLVCFLMVSPEKHDGPLPPIPEHHPEQGFPTSRQADQGPWAGTRTERRLRLCVLNGESPSGGASPRRQTQRQLDVNTMLKTSGALHREGRALISVSGQWSLTPWRGAHLPGGPRWANGSDNHSDRLWESIPFFPTCSTCMISATSNENTLKINITHSEYCRTCFYTHSAMELYSRNTIIL